MPYPDDYLTIVFPENYNPVYYWANLENIPVIIEKVESFIIKEITGVSYIKKTLSLESHISKRIEKASMIYKDTLSD